jgi:cytochrome c oxidase cbb3-type subunit 4
MEQVMDINTLRSTVTVLTFVIFLGIIWWAMSRRNQANFDEAAQLPFRQED